ncbi:MAG TPA: hypothetical protein VJU86_20945 [Pyrinomonadaceae bacterium]|nr:hypothetical protein [Pyrinomonadaceae bacterium]
MKRSVLSALFLLAFSLGGLSGAQAQVKQVEMHIGGYLCGN